VKRTSFGGNKKGNKGKSQPCEKRWGGAWATPRCGHGEEELNGIMQRSATMGGGAFRPKLEGDEVGGVNHSEVGNKRGEAHFEKKT